MESLSIITCVYNGAKYIQKLFDSILRINDVFIEHIIINDGSTDNLDELISQYSSKTKSKSNIKIVYKTITNHGLGYATDYALKYITSDYWTWINCDDWYLTDCFEPLICQIKKRKIDFIQLNYSTYILEQDAFKRKNHKRIDGKEIKKYKNPFLLKRILYTHNMAFLHYIVCTNSFKKINPSFSIDQFRGTQDVQLAYQIFGNLKGYFYDEPVIAFFERRDSLYSSSKYSKESYLSAGLNSLSMLSIDKKNYKSQYSLILAGYHYSEFFIQYAAGKNKQAKEHYFVYLSNLHKITFHAKRIIPLKIRLFYLCAFCKPFHFFAKVLFPKKIR